MEYPIRKLPRLQNYNYATPGAYFITICTHNKQCIFGTIQQNNNGDAYLQHSPIGLIAEKCLRDMESHYENVKLDNWVIMPNHIHLLIHITERMNPFPTAQCNISSIVGQYKASVTRRVGNGFIHSGKLWQTSFYDHIVRGDEDYRQIWQYISGNPSKWLEDRFYC